jgi:hypothetical protein
MRVTTDVFAPLLGISLLVLSLVSCSHPRNAAPANVAGGTAAPEPASTQQTEINQQRKNAEQQARPEIEQQRQEAQKQAEESLDKDAIAAIDETQKALIAIAANKTDDALAAIERATGKINILLARNPATALLPVNDEVDVIDGAPQSIQAIRELAQDASRAVDEKDFPTARALLYTLMSEIRVRIYNLPLATYPQALQEAARLLDQKKPVDAGATLLAALNTLVLVDHVTPLPLVLAREAINQAQQKSPTDKATAQELLKTAKIQLERSKELGYAGKDEEYASLNNDISNLQKQLKGNNDLTAVLAKLKEKMSAFLKRQSEHERG